MIGDLGSRCVDELHVTLVTNARHREFPSRRMCSDESFVLDLDQDFKLSTKRDRQLFFSSLKLVLIEAVGLRTIMDLPRLLGSVESGSKCSPDP